MNWFNLSQKCRYFVLVGLGVLSSLLDVSAVSKPVGLFASSGATEGTVLQHESVRGVLIRVAWSSLEPTLGQFDFSDVHQQLAQVESAESQWSLAVIAGGMGSPDWLVDELNVPYVDYKFRGGRQYRLPVFWDDQVQLRLRRLADALADRYGERSDLALVYVPQMTSNGIEGHLLGVDMAAMYTQGYSDDKWVEAVKRCAHSFAAAFQGKALAVEVHELNGGASVPSRIINELWADPALEQRVGAAMWWLSGRTNYQSDLIDVLTDYPGDIYGQVIGRSDQTRRFGEGGYAQVFEQAKAIGIRYVEPWEYEFKTGKRAAAGAWDSLFMDFNAWADATYAAML
jgi:hypothetical protein